MPRKATKTGKKTQISGKRYAMNMRTTAEVRRLLESAAAESGRSLAQEIEFRIERSLHDQRLLLDALDLAYGPALAGILQVMGEAMNLAGQTAGFTATYTLEGSHNWSENPYAFSRAKEAAIIVLDAIKPPGDPTPPASQTFEPSLLAETILEEAATGHTRATGTVQRARRLHRAVGPIVAERLSRFTTPEFRDAGSHIGDDQ